MSIFLDENSKIIVQGLTGSEGTKHAGHMLRGGSNIVGGTNPRKAGTTVEIADHTLPIFGTVADAMAETGANVSVVFVPPAFAKSAVIEAVDAAIPLVIVITEGIPVHDSAQFWAYAKSKGNVTQIIGPNCPGVISPGKSNAGIIPATIAEAGPIGLVSKSGTLTYQMMFELRDLGFSSAIEADPETKAIVMIGEIGGDAEERAAEYIRAHVTKPVVAYVAGFTAPEGKTMGHAGAIVSNGAGTAQGKKVALEAAGVRVGKTPSETAAIMRELVAAL